MPSIRIGFSTDFNLTNEQVGIGTTVPTARLDVRGQILSDNLLGSGGVSTVTRYDGFLSEKQVLAGNITVSQTGKGNLNSLSGEIVIENEVTVTEGTPLTGGRLDSLTVTGGLDIPQGGTLSRSATPEKGSTRFNSDLGQLEFYTGTEWRTVGSYDGSGRGRGVIMGTGTRTRTIEYITIATLGNSSYFGDATFAGGYRSASSSSTRGIYSTGYPAPTGVNNIDYLTLASQGNSIDFGDATQARYGATSLSSQTRSVTAGGYVLSPNTSVNTIDYVQIATIGNALDFGDLPKIKSFNAGCSSPTRGIYGGVALSSSNATEKSIVSLTISTLGNAIEFGDLTVRRDTMGAAVSNGTRAVFAGGTGKTTTGLNQGQTNIIDYVTISTFGNASYFGDLTLARNHMCSVQSIIRGVFAGGVSALNYNIIEYITITSTGNAQDFGDLSIEGRTHNNGASDSHGGLGGF